MELGFNGDLAMYATAIGAITKFVLFPLAQLRRRLDSNGDGEPDDVATGSFYIHPDVQSVLVLFALLALTFVVSLASNQPLFPLISATATGYTGARAAHEGIGAIKK